MIRNIVFDMGNVLIHWRPALFVERMAIPEEDRPALLREVFGSVEWIQMDRGTLSFEEGLGAICRRLPERLRGPDRGMPLDWWRQWLLTVEDLAEQVRVLRAL